MTLIYFFAAIARRIWLRRNAVIFEGVSDPPNKIYADAVASVEEFHTSSKGNDLIPSAVSSEGSETNGWKTPPTDTIKINFDAAINKSKGYVGLGIIARDSLGNVLGAKRLTKFLSTDSHIAEVMPASYAVIFSKEVGFFDVIFEGDALRVIKEVNSGPPLPLSHWPFY
jgi:hypothetical protein